MGVGGGGVPAQGTGQPVPQRSTVNKITDVTWSILRLHSLWGGEFTLIYFEKKESACILEFKLDALPLLIKVVVDPWLVLSTTKQSISLSRGVSLSSFHVMSAEVPPL